MVNWIDQNLPLSEGTLGNITLSQAILNNQNLHETINLLLWGTRDPEKIGLFSALTATGSLEDWEFVQNSDGSLTVNKTGSSIGSILKWLISELDKLAEAVQELQSLKTTIGTPVYHSDLTYNSFVTNNTVFNYLRFLYQRISPLSVRTFNTRIQQIFITEAILPRNINLNPPSGFQEALIGSCNDETAVEVDILVTNDLPVDREIGSQWLWTLIDGEEIVLEVNQSTSDDSISIWYKPSTFNVLRQLRLILSLPGDFTFPILVPFNFSVNWQIYGKIDSTNFPTTLLKSDDYGDARNKVTTQSMGTVYPIQSEVNTHVSVGDSRGFLVNTPQTFLISPSGRRVWFSRTRNDFTRLVEIEIDSEFVLTQRHNLPLVANFKFDFKDGAGNVLTTKYWLHPIKSTEESAFPFTDVKQTFWVTFDDIDINFVSIDWTPQYVLWTVAMGKTGVFDAGVTYTEPDPYLTGWSHNVNLQFYLRAIENSLITVQHREAERIGIERNLGFMSEEIGACDPDFMQMCMGDLTKADTTAAKSFVVSTDGTLPAFLIYGIQDSLTEDAAKNTGALVALGDNLNLKTAAFVSKGADAQGSYRRMYEMGIGIYAIFHKPSDSTNRTPHLQHGGR